MRGSLPAVHEFYQIKKEFMMERKEREIVMAKRIQKIAESYNRGSRDLPTLVVGVRVQNQTTTRTTKWDKTDMVTKLISDRKYEVMMDGSRRITTRNRRHLRRIPGKKVELEENEEEEEQVIVPRGETLVPTSVPEPSVLVPEPSVLVPEPSVIVQGPVPVATPAPAEALVPVPGQDVLEVPRRSARPRSGLDRLVVTGNGKIYARAVKENLGKHRGKEDVSGQSTGRTSRSTCGSSPSWGQS